MDHITLLFFIVILVLQLILLVKKPKDTKQADEQRLAEMLRKVWRDALEQIAKDNRALREELSAQNDRLRDSQSQRLSELTQNNQTAMDGIRNKLDERLDKIQKEFENAFVSLQNSNERKLDQMRAVVNEKLEKTLETRLQKSFETVSSQLENVYKGLGEMKTVAESVGSLNRVLAGTKSRGAFGELQLGQIIEDMLPAQLYDKEVATVKGASERVEYAIKLPGTEEGKHVYLPVDAKFPLEDYQRLLDAYEAGDRQMEEASRKALKERMKKFAKDVRTKYVSPPETTSFAVIFLPTEGLYAEIAKDSLFFDSFRKEGIVLTGPTTLSAMLNALQVGFKTLQLQKGASDIEEMLGAVKKEFKAFENVLNKANEKIRLAGDEIERLVGVRTRAINKSLQGVTAYTGDDTRKLLGPYDEGV